MKLKLTVLAAAAAFTASIDGASAIPLDRSLAVQNDDLVQNVRVVCDNRGRCWEVRRGQRVYVAPPRNYRAYRHYDHHHHNYNRGVGIGVGPVDIYVR